MKPFLTLYLLVLSQVFIAQISFDKGTRQASGTFYGMYQASRVGSFNIREAAISFIPTHSWFLARNFSLGAQLNFTLDSRIVRIRDTNSVLSDDTYTRTYIGPVARLYSRKGIFGEFAGAVSFYTNDGRSALNITQVRAGIGYCKLLNGSVAIEPVLSYALVMITGGSSVQYQSLWQLGIGLSYYYVQRG